MLKHGWLGLPGVAWALCPSAQSITSSVFTVKLVNWSTLPFKSHFLHEVQYGCC